MKTRILPVCCSFFLIFAGCGFHPNGSSSQLPSSTSSHASSSSSASSSSGTSLPQSQSGPAGTVKDYFPILENVRYRYEGAGNEYASYDMYIDYTSDTKVQQRVNNGGTETVRVISVGNGKVTRVFSQSEVYYRENFLGKTSGAQDVLLKEPIQTGTSWKLGDGSARSITGVSVPVSTPSGRYSAVSVTTKKGSDTTVDYYAKNIGLVKTVTTGTNDTISSSLSEIRKNVPLIQTVRFFYPNINDDKLYYKDRKISFWTNNITRKVLETAYKTPISGQPGKVFSTNTRINSLYLNRDGKVYIDLNRSFLTEMNAGAGYESMILQCVANTFGFYYDKTKVLLTIDNGLYESGHIKLEKGEFLSVKTAGAVAIS